MDHLLLDKEGLSTQGVEFHKINRGGDITFHGPGQIVGYPILDLDDFYTDVHKYVRMIEQVIINVLKHYNIDATREEGYTGVWLPANKKEPKRKICAIGIHLSRWVSMHGFAFNVNTDLSFFEHIVPCGISDNDKAVSSLARELGRELDIAEVKRLIAVEFANLFEWKWAESNAISNTFA
jgi:lipoyl(octanoyl) transferase